MRRATPVIGGALFACVALSCARNDAASNPARGESTACSTSADSGALAPPAPADAQSHPSPVVPAASPGRGNASSGSASPPATPVTPPPRATTDDADTVRGIAAVVGTSMDSRVIVKPRVGGPSVTLAGELAADIGRVSGADVWVSGVRTGETRAQMTVRRFAVRSVDGAPALDGTLQDRTGDLVLVTSDGREHVVANAPEALRRQVGARVWITGSLSTGAVTFGVIRPRASDPRH